MLIGVGVGVGDRSMYFPLYFEEIFLLFSKLAAIVDCHRRRLNQKSHLDLAPAQAFVSFVQYKPIVLLLD